ncbi:hypothetical protein CCH79_00007421 [Gambusia affinis]|uniref:FXYD domain-containing ion transport regulator n=1 Tax=Gambusia affinis TaxID=33528 RepID=A0A315WZR8_GAMAF|nr:hypothetical protein CCH79_00007421 [Gambusia affinis]
MSKIPTLVFVTFLSLVSVNAEATNDNYHRLRVGGLILAAVLCLIGITILFSGHCRCKFNQNKRRRTGSNAQQMLNDQGGGTPGVHKVEEGRRERTGAAGGRACDC